MTLGQGSGFVRQAGAQRLPSYGFLEKVYLERILRPEEV